MAESCSWVSNIKISILLKRVWFPYVKVSLKGNEYHIYMPQLSLQSIWGKDCSGIIWNQKQVRISKCYLVRLQALSTQLNSLFVFFPIHQWPCHNNIVIDTGLNLFDDCEAKCVGKKSVPFLSGDTVKCTLLAP